MEYLLPSLQLLWLKIIVRENDFLLHTEQKTQTGTEQKDVLIIKKNE